MINIMYPISNDDKTESTFSSDSILATYLGVGIFKRCNKQEECKFRNEGDLGERAELDPVNV